MITAYRILLRTVVTKARLAALGALALIPVVLAIALRAGHSVNLPESAYGDLVGGYCLGLLAPVVALVMASAAFGDLVDDGTLVYLWLKPVPRWKLTGAALAASLSVAVPLVVLPAAVSAAITGAGHNLVAGAAASTAIAVVAYAALFLGLGLRVRRALAWGLAYVLIWEGAVAHVARGAARASIQVQARSLLAEICAHAPPRNAVSTSTAIVVSAIAITAGIAFTTRWLSNASVA